MSPQAETSWKAPSASPRRSATRACSPRSGRLAPRLDAIITARSQGDRWTQPGETDQGIPRRGRGCRGASRRERCREQRAIPRPARSRRGADPRASAGGRGHRGRHRPGRWPAARAQMSASLLDSARSALAGLIALAQTRCELFGVELREELARLATALLGGLVVLVLAVLGAAFAAF